MLKKIVKAVLPPIITKIIIAIGKLFVPDDPNARDPNDPNTLFDGDDSLFKDEVMRVDVYGEYGCGKSTKWVLNNTSAQVIAVDTSSDWIQEVQSDNQNNNDRLNIHHANLGEVREWGMPLSYIRQDNFSDYTDYLWSQKEKPSLVLVDGRFRVCCFLTSLKFAAEGTKILFDDYTNRPWCHFVEKHVPRVKECGRQCLFVVPAKNQLDMDELDRDIAAFRNVME